MSDFEVCPIGTVARLAAVEAELRSMHRCFGVTERARDKYKAERDALQVFAHRMLKIHEDRDDKTAQAIVQQVIDAALAKKGGSNG
jgi:hypothetical protein